MKRTIFLAVLVSIIFSGCFYPFTSEVTPQKKEITLPQDGPIWLINPEKSGYVTQIGAVDNVDKKELSFHKQRALINASHNLTKKLYTKILKLYRDYEEETNDALTYDKDVKKFAEHISLKSLTHSKVINTWLSSDNKLFVQIAVPSDTVTEQIQGSSKLLFKVNKNLYRKFLSNRAKKDIGMVLEEF